MLIPVEQVKGVLIWHLGAPDDEDALNEYIDFVLTHEYLNDDCYCEEHHILPQCIVKNRLTFRLKYSDHCKAHELLFKAYNIRSLGRTLNFMTCVDKGPEYSKQISEAAKRAWVKFRKTEKYKTWRKNRSDFMKAWANSPEGQLATAKGHATRWSKDGAREAVSEHFKSLWNSPEKRSAMRAALTEAARRPENVEAHREITQKFWDDKTDAERKEFSDKMSVINKDSAKRAAASKSIKAKWQDPEFKEKMSNRKRRSAEKDAEHGSKIKALWADPVWRANMLAKRKAKRK